MALRLNGSTSGYTTLDAPAVAGSNTLVLPTGNGSSGQVLSTNGSGALSWIGAGKILQVVNATYSTSTSNSTSTYADTGLSASITPSSSSSKVLVLVNQAGCNKNGSTYMALRLLRGSTTLIQFEGEGGYTNSTAANSFGACSCCYLDSPATTSATTYKTQLASVSNVASVAAQGSSAVSTITLLEVAA
jgi:hypothetical protein